MKNLIFVFFFGALLVSCEDYSQQFDEINAAVEELAAENAALEAQLLGMQAASASAAQATAAQLAGFQAQVGQITAALTSIVQGLGELGEGTEGLGALVQALAAQVAAINAQIAAIVTNIDALSTDGDTLAAMIAAIQDAIDDITCQIAQINGEECAAAVVPTDNGDGALDLIVTVPEGTTMLRLSGPWWGWDPSGGPVGTDNGDGTFTFTLDPAPTADMEYLYTVDGVAYENLIDNAANAECTTRVDGGLINTDYANYANRIWKVGSGDQAETYDSCEINTVTAN
jgi:outer membrane murein-binding lipoprotein Lpp